MARQLERELSNRHIQLIAIGGAIGTGLFLGSGQTISLTGPSLLITYLIIGIVLFAFMRALGELLLSNTFQFICRYCQRIFGTIRWFCHWLDILVILDCFKYV